MGRVAEQAPGFRDGRRDHSDLGGRGLVRVYRGGCLGVSVQRRRRTTVRFSGVADAQLKLDVLGVRGCLRLC